MKSSIEITAVNETGLLGKVAVVLVKKGFKINRQTVSDQEGDKLCLMSFDVESQHGLTNGDIEHLKAEIPGLVEIRDKSAVNGDIRALLDKYGPRLISQYPAIRETLKECAAELPASARAEVLAKLGRGLGRWQYGQKYALGGLLSLDKTLQRMLWPSLHDFLDIEADGNQASVKDCPVCAGGAADEDHCHFIEAYMQGFLGELSHLPATTVIQSAAAAAGAPHCSFEVRGDGA